jgi:hypothetical protein
MLEQLLLLVEAGGGEIGSDRRIAGEKSVVEGAEYLRRLLTPDVAGAGLFDFLLPNRGMSLAACYFVLPSARFSS